MRLATPLALLLLTAAALGGCGSSSGGESTGSGGGGGVQATPGASVKGCKTDPVGAAALAVTGGSCGEARRVMQTWQRSRTCAPTGGASRGGCTVRSYRCLATRTARGLAVDCARPGTSIRFTAKRR